jgi:ribosomal protein S18 acetylase RimI-like enzyme
LDAALRPVQPGDEPFLLSVYAGTREEELSRVPWPAEQKAAFVAQQFAAQTAHYAQHYPSMGSHVVLVDGVPAGRLLVARWTSEIRIVDISLLPGFRGRGVGSRLLAGLQEEAAAAGRKLSIHVEKFNPALRLYERLGFLPVEDKELYLLMEWGVDEGAGAAR